MRLSLAMIVKNEAKALPQCLASLQGLVEETVILDTGSTDGTQEIARSFGARVEPFTWVDDFSKARNAAISHCTGDWILVLDADERIHPLDHAAVRQALDHPHYQAWFLTLRDYFTTGAFIGLSGAVKPNLGPYPEYSHQTSYEAVRLFKRQPEPVFQGCIHELAEVYFQTRQYPMGHLDAVIHHFGKVDPDRDRAKQREYTRLAKLEAQADPGDPMKQFNVVQQGLLVDDWEAVLHAANAYLALCQKVPLMIYLGASKALMGLGRAKECLPYLNAMLLSQPHNATALHLQGEVMEQLGRHAEAQHSYLLAMESEPTFTLPFLRLSRLLERSGAHENARQVLEAALDQNPKDELLWSELVAQAGKHWPEQAIQDAWQALQQVPQGGQGLWHKLVLSVLIAQKAHGEAQEVLQRGLAAFPQDADWPMWEKRLHHHA